MTDSILLFENTQPTSLEAIRILRLSLSKILDRLDVQKTVKNPCLLCFSEWSTNLVLHPKNPSKSITIALRKTKHHWQLDIIDDGEAWDPTAQPSNPDIGDFSLKCGGRGIDIIQSQTHTTAYHSFDTHNLFSMTWIRENHQKRPHILIVEDDVIQCKLYSAYLNQQFELTLTNNGKEALDFLKNNTVDLIVSDIQMPEMGGLELRQHLEQDKDISIPFIFLSHLQDTTTVNSAVDLGIDDYLEKPIKKDQLLYTIQRVLARFNQVYQSLSKQVNQKITHTLLPQIEIHSPHWKLAIQQRNTGHGGGDFVLSMDDDDITQILLADVMGHDESAKFFAYAYAGYIRGLMQNSDLKHPAQLLSTLSNNAFKDQILSQTMLTSCCVSLLNSNTLAISSAGHPPPIHITNRGLSIINVEGTLPGLLPNTTYQETKITLQQKERIAFFTDGLFESGDSLSERETLEKAVKQQLINTFDLPIESAMEHIMQTFDSLAGTPPNDDALLLILEKQ